MNKCIICKKSNGPGELRSFPFVEGGVVFVHGGHRTTSLYKAGYKISLEDVTPPEREGEEAK